VLSSSSFVCLLAAPCIIIIITTLNSLSIHHEYECATHSISLHRETTTLLYFDSTLYHLIVGLCTDTIDRWSYVGARGLDLECDRLSAMWSTVFVRLLCSSILVQSSTDNHAIPSTTITRCIQRKVLR